MQVEQDSAEASNSRFDNKVNGMTEDTAKRSIDWLLRTDVTDKLADGGISTLNIVVDAGTEPSPPSGMRLPKTCGIATDYHINESPLLEQDEHSKHADNNVTYITRDDWPLVEETIQWLTEKQDSRIKNGQLEHPPLADGRPHEGESLPVELPCRSEFHDHSCRRNARAVFPEVHRQLRLGCGGPPQVRNQTARSSKRNLPDTLLFNPESHPGLVLQRSTRRRYFFKQLAHGFRGCRARCS